MQKDSTLDDSFCQEEVDKISKNLAIKWLNSYEKQRKDPIFSEVAEIAFRVHLFEKEPKDENSKMRFYFAEHIFGLKKFLEASQEYDKVGDSTEDKERKHKARYAAIFSFDKNFNSDYKKPEEESRFKELSNKYMNDFPKGEEYLNVAFKLALFDYTKKNYEAAAPLLLSLGENFKTQEKGKKSQDLYLDILNSKKEYQEIQKYAKLWQSKDLDPERAKSLQNLYEQSFFSEVEVLEKAEEFKSALKRYEEFINENPQSQFVDEARWNKISMHFKLKEYDKTAESYVSFYNLHPRHKNVTPGLIKAVEIYEMMAEPEKAVAVTKILEKVDPKNSSKWFYLTSSYLMSSGNYELAAKNFYQIMGQPGVFKDTAIEAFFSVDTRLDTSTWYQATLTNLLRSKNKTIAQMALNSKVNYLERQGNKKDLYDFVYNEIRISELAQSQKGPLYYHRGKKKSEEFFAANISNRSMNTIVAGIQEKTRILDYAQNLFQKGLSSDDQKYVIKSLIGLSELYDSYVNDLKNLRAPASFGPEEAEALQQELANIIMPFEEKSADVLNQATQVAKGANFRDGTMGKVRSLFDIVNLDEKTVHNIKARLPSSAGPRGI
jgi:tetratricopeptide (TPR) repeat protein